MRAVLLLLALLAGCAPGQHTIRTSATDRSAAASPSPRVPPPQRWVAVLVAGDGSLPVFDNATAQLGALLQAVGTAPRDIQMFSAAPGRLSRRRVQLATKPLVLDAIAGLHPAPGQGCFVFLTSHGARRMGLFLAPDQDFLPPAELAEALDAGCGDAPTVAIVSGCFTGAFARPPVARPNRVVLTAAAADRPSFGCGAGQTYTYFDTCLLHSLQSLPDTWPGVIADTGRCVAALEAEAREPSSRPQSSVGAMAAAIPVPGRGRLLNRRAPW